MADEGEAAVAEGVEVIDELLDAGAVIDADVGDVGAGGADVVKDAGDFGGGEFVDEAGVHFRDDEGEAGDAAADHEADGADEAVGVVVGVGDDDFEAAAAGLGFEGAEDVEEEGVLHVGGDEADGMAFASGESAGMEIGGVVEIGDGFENAGAGGAADDVEIVEDARDGGGGDAGAFGHFFKIHGTSVSYCDEVLGFEG